MTALSYAYAWLPAVIVFGVLATIAVPLFAIVSLVVLFVLAFAALVALGWGLVTALRAVGRRPWLRWLQTAKRQRSSRRVPLNGSPGLDRGGLLWTRPQAALARQRKPERKR